MIAGISVVILTHEVLCVFSRRHDDLLTRVIGRWRITHPVLTDLAIVYLALHLMDRVPHDPLRIQWRQ